MIPGNELILKCPYCQARKTIMSLISANSSGVIKWSDGYTVMPMYPQNSEIQQCSRCKKYFLINEQSKVGYASTMSLEPSLLTFSQWQEALEQFQKEKQLNRETELIIRLHIWWHHNHTKVQYTRSDFEQNCNRLLALMDRVGEEYLIMSAEIYRELGYYNKSLDLLRTVDVNSWGHEIKEAAIQKITDVFILKNENKGYCIFL